MTKGPESLAVELNHVSFAYNGGEPILHDVNLRLGATELASVVGPNGGGKTTLLKLILGLLRPASGTVRVFGAEPERSRRRLGYMPQHLHFDPHFPVTALEIALLGRLRRGWGGFYSRRDKEVARAALAEMGAEALAGRPFAELSGGQRQRVLIARALACEPDMLLLDEPTSSIDAMTEEKLFEKLRELKQRMAVLVVSHDVAFVSRFVERVVCVNRRVVSHPTEELGGRRLEELYGEDFHLIRHDRHLPDEGAAHD